MCKLGDIIVVNNYKGEDGKEIRKHSFVVIDDESGTIAGLEYSFVASVISSFKNVALKKKKLSYEGNIELPIDSMTGKKFKKDSYVKVDQAFYFEKNKIDYYVLGSLNEEYLSKLVIIIINLANQGKLKRIVENLK